MNARRPVVVLLTSHWISVVGTVLVTTAGLLWLFALPLHVRGHADNPYIGIVLFLILPMAFFAGLALIPVGAVLAKRRVASGLAGSPPDRAAAAKRLVLFLGITTVANVVIGLQLSYRAVEHMETVQFCGQSCHVMTPQFSAHAVAPHSRVACVHCHVASGAVGWLHSKINGSKQMLEVMAGTYDRPIPPGIATGRLVPAGDTCESCHARLTGPPVRLRVTRKHADDENNTMSWTVLSMKLGVGRLGGIHAAHLGPNVTVRYASSDPARQTIPWVEVTRRPEGTVTTFIGKDVRPDAVSALPKFAMQCTDCHNRAAHTFELPGPAIDRAMGSGEISSELPFVKKKAIELLKADYASGDDARARIVSDLRGFYAKEYPDVAASRPQEIDRAAAALSAIWSRNIFPDMKVTWGTYPNNLGHMEFPGCFRCHDGEHATADAEASIEQDCSTCHEAIAVEEPNPEILKTLGLN